MLKLISKDLVNQEQCVSDIKESIDMCEAKFRQILSEVLECVSKEAHGKPGRFLAFLLGNRRIFWDT